jgi:hypothetical protein
MLPRVSKRTGTRAVSTGLATAALAFAALLAMANSTLAARTVVPPSLLGMQAWADPSDSDLQRMSSGGVRTLRDNLSWSVVEPTRGARHWERYDGVFERAARAGIEVFPVLVGTPSFAAKIPQYPPRTVARPAWTRFVRDAVARYGRNGGFWRAHPELPQRPVTAWQVWNEPNLPFWWNGRPNVNQYLTLLQQTRKAIRSRDARARIVLAGMPVTARDTRVPHYLRAIYRRQRVKRLFDAVAIHAFAGSAAGAVGVVRRARAIMRAAGDGATPLWVTEIGWGSQPSAIPPHLSTDERTQAARLTASLTALARQQPRLLVERAFWFAWQDRALVPGEQDWWAPNTGLFRADGSAKPSWAAFRRLGPRS